MRRQIIGATAACALLLTGCVSRVVPPPAAAASGSTATSGFRGDYLPNPIRLSPAAARQPFTVASGGRVGGDVTLGQLQAAHPLLLVYFGYTNCPDECPTIMANLGVALRSLPVASQKQVEVAFVTSDPRRDTPAALGRWLTNFDVGLPVPFAGLNAPVATVDPLAGTLGVPLSPPVTKADGTVDVEHGTQVLAFRHGQADLVWLSDATPADLEHDIPRLLASA